MVDVSAEPGKWLWTVAHSKRLPASTIYGKLTLPWGPGRWMNADFGNAMFPEPE